MAKSEQRTAFKASDGRYVLHSEKTHGLVQFASRRSTRLTLAELHGGHEEGVYIIYNSGDYLHISPYDATEKEPMKSMIFNPSTVRDGFPCCHAYCADTRDGQDLVVGIANGEVLLMSLRAQLQAPLNSTKVLVTAKLNEDNASDSSQLHAVAWVPKTEGMQFLAAFGSGVILVYKKNGSMVGEGNGGGGGGAGGGGKFLSHLSNKAGSGLSPMQTITVGCGGIFDAAFSPTSARLAIACRDGTLRVLEWPSGQCVGGFQSYYGALLCCCWSGDGKLIATGGEDDLVTWYSVTDRCQVAWGEGHSSWVGRVAFDTHWEAPPPTTTSQGEAACVQTSYRVGSVGQDTCLALWDITVEEDPSYVNATTGQTGMKRVASASHLNVPTVSSAANLAALADAAGGGVSISGASHPSHHGGGGGGGGDFGGLARQGSGTLASRNTPGAATIAPVVEQEQMTMLRPVMLHKIHVEPLADILFTEEAIFTACCGGAIKSWLRPQYAAEARAA